MAQQNPEPADQAAEVVADSGEDGVGGVAVATVLIVEDEALVRTVLQMELEDAGYDVIIADCADAAIAILEDRAGIHLVFTDIDMPGSMNGLKLAACVRSMATRSRHHHDRQG